MHTGDWHYVRGEQQFGPVPFQVLQSLARTGDVSADDLVWSEGMPDWVPAQSIQGLFTPARPPRIKSGGRRSSGRRRTGGRPASRSSGRAFGGNATAPVPFGAQTAGPPGMGETAAKRADKRRAQRPSTMPGGIIVAAICDFLVVGLTTARGLVFLATAEHARRLSREQTDQALTNFHWDLANAADTTATIDFLIAGVFTAVAIVLLTKQSWGPIAQTILSVLASLPYFMALGGNANVEESDAALVILLSVMVLVFLLTPIGCVWSRGAQDWLRPRSAGRRGGPPQRRARRGY